jgi:Flp pilus assembly protein CpaB
VNVLKHMEAVFVVAVSLAGSASYLAANLPQAQAAAPAADVAAIATPTKMAVVTVSAKRLSTAEKQQLSLAARSGAANRT